MTIPLNPADVVPLFRRSFPTELLGAITHTICECCEISDSKAQSLVREPHSRELKPWIRRTTINEGLEALGGEIDGIEVETIRSRGSTHYIQMETPEAVLLIARAIDVNDMIPHAKYRDQLAIRSLQSELFAEAEAGPRNKLYGVILYGGDREGTPPTFVAVRFPTGDHKAYLPMQIDLLAEFGSGRPTAPVERVEPTDAIRLHRPSREGEAGA